VRRLLVLIIEQKTTTTKNTESDDGYALEKFNAQLAACDRSVAQAGTEKGGGGGGLERGDRNTCTSTSKRSITASNRGNHVRDCEFPAGDGGVTEEGTGGEGGGEDYWYY